MLLWAMLMTAIWLAISVMIAPRPKLPKPAPLPVRKPDPKPELEHDPKPELEHDPSAFWRYPDWDSGPIDEPFWMRPLKLPVIRDLAFENCGSFNGMPIIPGRYRIEPVISERWAIGLSYRYFVDDQEVLPPALLHPPKVL